MDQDGVLSWVAGYERAWREGDLTAVAELFTDGVRYRVSPYADPLVGPDGVRSIWLSDTGEGFTCTYEVVAVQGDAAVVRLLVQYGEPVRQEYRDLWVLHFDEDSRVDDFEEWAYWPGKPYTASGEQ